jgi:mono/diheme cytochrome c family protein
MSSGPSPHHSDSATAFSVSGLRAWSRRLIRVQLRAHLNSRRLSPRGASRAAAAVLLLAFYSTASLPLSAQNDPRPGIDPPPPAATEPNPVVQTGATNDVFAWDARIKEYKAKPGESAHLFTFKVTNVSVKEAVINSVDTSCGCTVAKLPSQPWLLAPGANGELQATVDWRGKWGVLIKTITLATSAGPRVLTVKVDAGDLPADTEQMSRRTGNLRIAAADRQAVFKNECAKCHAEPAAGKTGAALYRVACAICHDTPHPANSMVPNLWALNHPTDRAFWQQWVAHGKINSLMPAFAKSEGGPLSEEQIDSLAGYLERNVSRQENAPLAPIRKPW